ncbi:unnamed protein product, partial [Heterosigma akashiwo]
MAFADQTLSRTFNSNIVRPSPIVEHGHESDSNSATTTKTGKKNVPTALIETKLAPNQKPSKLAPLTGPSSPNMKLAPLVAPGSALARISLGSYAGNSLGFDPLARPKL